MSDPLRIARPDEQAPPPEASSADLPALLARLDRLAAALERRAGPPAELLSANDVAAVLRVGLSTLERMKAGARLPRPLELSSGCHRWRRAEILDWIGAGCPPRAEWEARRRAAGGRA
jgi:predicted DNA-binding transcriptional regulator AlpA